MFIEKLKVWLLLRFLHYGRVTVKFWDGSSITRGKTGPHVTIEITDPKVVKELFVNASLAIGEAYMTKRLLISEDELPVFFELVAKNQLPNFLRQPWRRASNNREDQRDNIGEHYDVGNEYYNLFLDEEMRAYSCARFQKPDDSLEAAQWRKVEVLLNKLQLQPDSRLLDIGCGWGYLAVAAAKRHEGIQVLGITLSAEQLKGANELAKREGVADRVKFQLLNYQDLDPKLQFDRIVSVGMFEHVGKAYYNTYFAKVKALLVEGGISVLHTITQELPRPIDAWTDRYIFPGGYLPTLEDIGRGIKKQKMRKIHEVDWCWDYAQTLRLWRRNHQKHRDTIIEMFDEEFYRRRDFWLAGSEAGFQYGRLGLAQVVFTIGKLQRPIPDL